MKKNSKKKILWGVYNQKFELIYVFKETEQEARNIFEHIKNNGLFIKKIETQISKRYPRIKIYIPPKHTKYKGNRPPFARSSWEYDFMKMLDSNPYVVEWYSEYPAIPYKHPFRSLNEHKPVYWNYYPDFFIKLQKDNKIWYEVIEIKPYKQVIKPLINPYKPKRIIEEQLKTYEINKAKWEYAQKYCKERGWIFKIVTEKDLY